MKKTVFVILLLFRCLLLPAQDAYRYKTLKAVSDTLVFDTLSVVDGSLVFMKDTGLCSNAYEIDYYNARLVRKTGALLPDTLIFKYKVFPFFLPKRYYHKDRRLVQPSAVAFSNPLTYKPREQTTDIFKLEGLNRNGSITRGVSFGNNQDLVVNSNLNLQLSGKISDEISILAAIADDNIPVQPEGNTQQLQEFDKIFIQLNDKKSQLIAGDFVLTRPASHFLNYYKRAQGGSFSSSVISDKKNGKELKTDISYAISKGKFSRNVIIGIEGNQGPYRLTGSENEAFIIILSGTERIYIDGVLLQRGQENDYIIDYNTAQLTFTARRMITKDKRIIAEFQYSDRNYSRSLLTAGAEGKSGNYFAGIQAYNEEDNRNKPVFQNLTPADKDVMRQVGDSINSAFALKTDTVPFNTLQVLYAVRDTVVNGITFPNVYVYSTHPDSARYRPQFTDFGSGRGNYILVNSSANGRVYRWVAPENGVMQGNYEPLILLVTPKKKQMITGKAGYEQKGRLVTSLETAITTSDPNTFSETGNADNQGTGLFYRLDHNLPIGDSAKGISFLSAVKYEMVDKHFTFIERYRAVEFERDWNRNTPLIRDRQHLASVSAGFRKRQKWQALYQYGTFREQGLYNGQLQAINSFYNDFNWKITANGSYLSAGDQNGKNSFLRYRTEALRSFFRNKLIAGLRDEQEKSLFTSGNEDSLLRSSFHYHEWQAFIMNGDSLGNNFEVKFVERNDWLPSGREMVLASKGQSASISTAFAQNPRSVFKNTSTYRTLDVKDTTLIPGNKTEQTVVNRMEYSFRLMKGILSSSTFYEVGSGLEVRKEFSYIEVAAGQGNYTWKDYNNNGIRELNEFEIAVFTDQARYIRVYTPTNAFVKTYNTQFNEILNLNAPAKWSQAKSTFRKLVSRFSNQTAYRLERKTGGDSRLESLNPFSSFNFDSTIISLNANLRSTMYFNRNSPVFGMDYTYQHPRGRQLLTNGFESRSNLSHALRIRFNLTQSWLLSAENDKGLKYNKSQYFNTRDYAISYYNTEPKLTWQPGTDFKISASFKYTFRQNEFNDSNQVAEIRNAGFEFRYNQASRGSFTARGNVIWITYNSSANSPVAFEMLDALLPGTNVTWNIVYQRTLSNNMQVSFNYDGRAPEGLKAVHTGGVTVRAFF